MCLYMRDSRTPHSDDVIARTPVDLEPVQISSTFSLHFQTVMTSCLDKKYRALIGQCRIISHAPGNKRVKQLSLHHSRAGLSTLHTYLRIKSRMRVPGSRLQAPGTRHLAPERAIYYISNV